MMYSRATLIVLLLALFLTACQPAKPACTPDAISYQKSTTPFPEPTPAAGAVLPEQVEINGKMMEFDQVIHGPLCNNTLSGKVYIACDIVIAEWKDKPNFLDGCNFVVEPGAVVYVAAHQNTAYYKGCASCHVTGNGTAP